MEKAHKILQAVTMPRGNDPLKISLLSLVGTDANTNYRESLSKELKLSKTATLSHLKTLEAVGLIEKSDSNYKRIYRITELGKKVLKIIKQIERL